MHHGFTWHRRSKRVIATFSAFEADLLRSLEQQLIELLRNEAAVPPADQDPLEALLDFTGPTSAPDDPVLARLFPSAYRDDDEASGEFRRFTEGGLRSAKADAAGAVVDALEEAGLPAQVDRIDQVGIVVDVELTPDEALVWLRALADVRLALATRLGVEEGDEAFWADLPDDDPRAPAHDVYEWVGFLQETLVGAVPV